MDKKTPPLKRSQDTKNTAIILAFAAVAMVAFAYACVPLYRIFCQKTGFGGTPQVATKSSQRILDQEVKVEFVANTHRDVPWKFFPLQNSLTLKVGQNMMAYYRAENPTHYTIKGMATYNVSPDQVGAYFNKVHCFCFEEQTLKPGEVVDMPVFFYLDPDFVKDNTTKDIKTITLSYTFFRLDK